MRQYWTPAGAAYLLLCLGATCVGLWPELVYPRQTSAAPLPILHVLIEAQLVWFLLAWPMIALRRDEHRLQASASDSSEPAQGVSPPRQDGAQTLLEWMILLLATAPLYLMAGWLADATIGDVFRAVLVVVTCWPVALWLTALARRPGCRAVAPVLGLVLTVGGAALVYLASEYISPAGGQWIWDVLPVGLAWQTASARQTWATLDWRWLIAPTMGVLGLLGMQLWPRNKQHWHSPA